MNSRFILHLWLLTTIMVWASDLSAFSQIMASGRQKKTAPMPVNENFAVAAGENLMLRYPDGSILDLIAPSAGKTASAGITLRQSAGFVKLSDAAEHFSLQIPLAVITGTKCACFLQSNDKLAKIVVSKGRLKVVARAGKNIVVEAGETLLLSEKKHEIRKSSATDTAFWKLKPADSFAELPIPESFPRRFGELYIYSMAVLEKGGGTIHFSDPSRLAQSAAAGDILAPSGSRIMTGNNETAVLRLGEKTIVKIAADTEILLKEAQLEIKKGECLVRHGSTLLPVKIAGPSPFAITRDSSVEIARHEDEMLVTIQNGRVQIPVTGQTLDSGARFRISRTGIMPIDLQKEPPAALFHNYTGPLFSSPEEDFSESLNFDDLFQLSEEPATDNGNQQQSSPDSLLQQYEIRPEDNRK